MRHIRRAVALLAAVVGLALVALPFTYSMFGRTADAERILDRFEFLTRDCNPDRYLRDAVETRAGSSELVEKALPALAPESVTAADRRAVRRANRFSVRYSRQLEAVKGKFASVYDIPASGLSLTALPWLFLVAGVLCLVAGAVVLLTKGTVGLVATLALGAALVVGPLVLGAPGKAAGGEDVKEFATRGLTQRAATAASEASVALDGLLRDADERGLAAQRRRFPAAAELISDWDVIGPRLARLSRAVAASVGDFRSAKQLPMSSPVWLMLGAGLALALTAGVALLRSR